MDVKAAKELLNIHAWLIRVDEIVQRGKEAYLADALLQEAGDSLMMKLGEVEAPQVSRRILVSWKDATRAEEDRSEGQGEVRAAGAGALAGVPVADRCC